MTYHMSQRATAHPFAFNAKDPYWRKAASYSDALAALYADAKDNYKGGGEGPRPERTTLLDMLHAAALDAAEPMIPFTTRNLFSEDRAAHEDMFAIPQCFPYAARHYANIVGDMRDFAIASLKSPGPMETQGYGSLPALLTALEQNLRSIEMFERRPILPPALPIDCVDVKGCTDEERQRLAAAGPGEMVPLHGFFVQSREGIKKIGG